MKISSGKSLPWGIKQYAVKVLEGLQMKGNLKMLNPAYDNHITPLSYADLLVTVEICRCYSAGRKESRPGCVCGCLCSCEYSHLTRFEDVVSSWEMSQQSHGDAENRWIFLTAGNCNNFPLDLKHKDRWFTVSRSKVKLRSSASVFKRVN